MEPTTILAAVLTAAGAAVHPEAAGGFRVTGPSAPLRSVLVGDRGQVAVSRWDAAVRCWGPPAVELGGPARLVTDRTLWQVAVEAGSLLGLDMTGLIVWTVEQGLAGLPDGAATTGVGPGRWEVSLDGEPVMSVTAGYLPPHRQGVELVFPDGAVGEWTVWSPRTTAQVLRALVADGR